MAYKPELSKLITSFKDSSVILRNVFRISQMNGLCLATYVLAQKSIFQALKIRSHDPSLTYDEKLRQNFTISAVSGVITSAIFLPVETLRIRANYLQMISEEPIVWKNFAAKIYYEIKAQGLKQIYKGGAASFLALTSFQSTLYISSKFANTLFEQKKP